MRLTEPRGFRDVQSWVWLSDIVSLPQLFFSHAKTPFASIFSLHVYYWIVMSAKNIVFRF